MSNDLAIRVKGLSKRYHIGARQERYKTFRDTVTEAFRAPLRRLFTPPSAPPTPQSDTIWALKDVSFRIERGEAVGIIGRNGAGKSTLLKILSRITEPTEGQAEIQGRVGSLLEVGSGFHQELTGRENIFLNGAILGMRRAEIERKFDEIVAFAEVEKFIDMPVKHYSSGMYLRLAFAVGAYLEPEILIIDEVLAVGDVSFQQKCVAKMSQLAAQGRTVLFVSHNMGAIMTLCPRSIVLQDGQVLEDGETSAIVQRYLSEVSDKRPVPLRSRVNRAGNQQARIVECVLSNAPGGPTCNQFQTGMLLFVTIEVETKSNMRLLFGVQFADCQRNRLCSFNSREAGLLCSVSKGTSTLVLEVPWLSLLEGTYWVNGELARAEDLSICDRIDSIASFTVHARDFCGSGAAQKSAHGKFFMQHTWHLPSGRKHMVPNNPPLEK